MITGIKAHRIMLAPTKTYAIRANAARAVETHFGRNEDHFGSADVRYLLVQGEDLRWFPVFIGESALQYGIHHHFCVVAG